VVVPAGNVGRGGEASQNRHKDDEKWNNNVVCFNFHSFIIEKYSTKLMVENTKLNPPSTVFKLTLDVGAY